MRWSDGSDVCNSDIAPFPSRWSRPAKVCWPVADVVRQAMPSDFCPFLLENTAPASVMRHHAVSPASPHTNSLVAPVPASSVCFAIGYSYHIKK